MKEITYDELKGLENESYVLIDIRDEGLVSYGVIPGAVHIFVDDLENSRVLADISKEKKLIFYCEIGRRSREIDDTLEFLEGRDCYSLAEGYVGYIRSGMKSQTDKDEKRKRAEASIQKKFHKQLFSPFARACKTYKLIEEGDHIAVCISGGKDSMLMAKLMQQLKRVSETDFELVFLVMDPGYNEANRKKIEDNAKRLRVPITVFESDIFEIANNAGGSPCYLCARMRRGNLYAKAKELGCNKIALGHHFTDVIETTLLGMFYGSQLQAMLPKLHSTNFEGMELIRPMYCIREEAIIRWAKHNNLEFLQCACRFVDEYSSSEDGIGKSKRQEIKMLLKELEKANPGIEHSIFKSIHSVCLDTFPGYKQQGEYHSFLNEY